MSVYDWSCNASLCNNILELKTLQVMQIFATASIVIFIVIQTLSFYECVHKLVDFMEERIFVYLSFGSLQLRNFFFDCRWKLFMSWQ